MTKTRGFLLAVAVAAMAFTFSCSDDKDDGGDGKIPAALVAKWYSSQQSANNNGQVLYEFMADGRFLAVDMDMGYTYSISGSTITLVIMGVNAATATFSISGTVLTITNSSSPYGNSGSGAIQNGTYYKPAS